MKDSKGKNTFLKVFGTVITVLVVGFVIVFRFFDFASCVGRWIPHKDNADVAAEAPATDEYTIPHSVSEMDYDAVSWKSISDSTAFSSVGYDSHQELLIVQFRDSGKKYAYFEFPQSEWNTFINSESLGGYYNSNIKGQYESEKLE